MFNEGLDSIPTVAAPTNIIHLDIPSSPLTLHEARVRLTSIMYNRPVGNLVAQIKYDKDHKIEVENLRRFIRSKVTPKENLLKRLWKCIIRCIAYPI